MENTLQKGMPVPSFTLKNQHGEDVDIADYKGKKVLIYFYPKALTPGCTIQSCNLRDAKDDFTELNVDIIGISPDEPKKQLRFAEKKSLNFTLLCDTENSVATAFGVWQQKSMFGHKYMGIVRSSFLIDEEGNIIDAWYKVSPKQTVPKALAALK